MNIHDITQKATGHKIRKRRGRGDGSGLGCTSGKGHKGARARSGWKARYGYEGGQMPIIRRLPKRGFKNSIFSTHDVVNIQQLESVFNDGDIVSLESLRSKISFKAQFGRLKILGTGELTKKLNVEAAKFSESARQKIEASGGSCTIIAKAAPSRKKAEAESSTQ